MCFPHSCLDDGRPEVPMLFRDTPSLLIIFVLTMPQPLRKGTVTVPSLSSTTSTAVDPTTRMGGERRVVKLQREGSFVAAQFTMTEPSIRPNHD